MLNGGYFVGGVCVATAAGEVNHSGMDAAALSLGCERALAGRTL